MDGLYVAILLAIMTALFGYWIGSAFESQRIANDCRLQGVTRIDRVVIHCKAEG